mmetsp:Transcript_21229/g.24220  ORF Transcript_21229/g.24220 Transcript_21229/m.24220 type:complete len:843 (+) Transcript_21229:80-2608(+)
MTTAYRAAAFDGEMNIMSEQSSHRSLKRRSHHEKLGKECASKENRLNPHMKLRIRLIKEGFTELEIDKALEEMWEKELRYDDYNKVVSYINSCAAIKGQSDSERRYPPEEETKTASTAESTSTSTDQQLNCHRNIECHESDLKVESVQNSEQVIRRRQSAQNCLNISCKLDLVADYENLADAAFALSEWISKAADRDQIYEICVGTKTRALATVIRRTITETPDQMKFDDSILPSILHLVGSIFMNAGISSAAASATRKSLESVMQRARKAYILRSNFEQNFAERVSRYILSGISSAIEDLRSHGSDEGVDLILRLEDEIESLASSLVTGEGGVIELITKRDSTKVAAEKSSAVVGVAMATSFQSFEMPEETNQESFVEKKDILVKILGNAEVEKMKKNNVFYEEFEKKVSFVANSNIEERQNLQSNLVTFHAERNLVAERMEELRIAMRQLEEDDSELCDKILETRLKLKSFEKKNKEELEAVMEDLNRSKNIVMFEEAVDSLADCLKIYEESLKKAVTVSNIFENCEHADEFVPNKFGVYLIHMKNYFASESECVDFLQNRVNLLENEARGLKREIEECKALGMSATVSQMSDALSLNRQNISDDKCVINGLTGEAQSMLTNLTGRLDQYLFDGSMHQHLYKLTSLHITLIRGIAGTVEMMGLEDVNLLKVFLPNHDDSLPTVVTTSHDELDESSDTDLELSNQNEHNDDTSDNQIDEAIEVMDDNSSRHEIDDQNEEKSSTRTIFIQNQQNIVDEDTKESSITVTESENHDRIIACGVMENSTKNSERMIPRKKYVDNLVKKLTWANPTVQTKKPVVKSLIDIQKEELIFRGEYQADGT